MRAYHHRRRMLPGFTLVELLVVIALIAILAAILFPVFAQAREKARQAVCTSNVRQIGMAIMLYAHDYDETYPPTHLYYKPGVFGIWLDLIRPYAGVGNSRRPKRADPNWHGLSGLGICPTAPFWGLSYAMSTQFMVVKPGGKETSGLPIAAVTRPAEVAVITETPQWKFRVPGGGILGASELAFNASQHCWGGPTGDGTTAGSPDADGLDRGWRGCILPRYRHNGSALVAWADGHASWRRKGSLIWCRHINLGEPGPDCPR